MWGNTQPTLFEVKLWEDITTNALSSLVISRSSLYGAPHKLRTHTPLWFPDPRCRTSGREPTPFGPTTWHYDGDRWRRRQTKTKTGQMETEGDKGRDSRRRTQNHSGDERTGSSLTADAPPRVKTELDTSPLMQPADSRAHEGCSSRLSFI